MEFYQWLRQKRISLGWSQENLADRMDGFAATSISNIERGVRGKKGLSLPVAEGFAKALSISPDLKPAFVLWAQGLAEMPEALRITSPIADDALSPVNLPYYVGRRSLIIGREGAILMIATLLTAQSVRIVTLTGTGGIGKTRLAYAIADTLTDQFHDGVIFVNLADITDPALVLPTIAQTLKLKDSTDLRNYLRDQQMLLVLDNVEQVVDAGPQIAALSDGTATRLLITSRTALNVYGEHEYAVPPLGSPDAERPETLERLGRYPAVALFITRAQQARPDFALTPENAADVAAICAKLGGVPLALELAAARVRFLTPHAMVQQSLMRLLINGARDMPSRHQTLRATIAWSDNLLNDDERSLLRQLSVFAGAVEWDAIEAVCDLADADIFDALDGLLIHNFVYAINDDPRVFGMSEAIREYSRELCPPELHNRLALRHAAYFARLAVAAHEALRGSQQAAWLARLRQAQPDTRKALRVMLDHADTDGAALMAGYLGRFWNLDGTLIEGRRWLNEILARPIADDVARLRAVSAAGALAFSQGDLDAAELAFLAARDLAQRTNETRLLYGILGNLGAVAYSRNDLTQAIAYSVEAMEHARLHNDLFVAASSANNLGMFAQQQGRYAAATQYFHESLDIFTSLSDTHDQAVVLANIGQLGLKTNDALNDVEHYFLRAMQLLAQIADTVRQMEVLEGLAEVAARRGDVASAARLWGHAHHFRQQTKLPLTTPQEVEELRQRISDAYQSVDAATWDEHWVAGQCVPVETLIMEILQKAEMALME